MPRTRSIGRVRMQRWGFAVQVLLGALVAGSCSEPTVETNPVVTMELTPPTTSVRAGGTITLVARPLDAEGNTVDGGTITWSSSNATVATVSSAETR